MGNVKMEQKGDKIVITIDTIAGEGKLSSTGKTFLKAFGSGKFLASDGSQVVVGLNAYTKA
jgi:hypothetical protein